MKAYRTQRPVIVIGGRAGSFLGEYQAGGLIVVLGESNGPIVGNFCGTGMHGGEILLRCSELNIALPAQVKAERNPGPGSEEAASIIPGVVYAIRPRCGRLSRVHLLPADAEYGKPVPADVYGKTESRRESHDSRVCVL